MISEMIIFDWILLAILLMFCILGFIRGAFSSNIPIFGVFLALYLSVLFKDFFANWVQQYFNNEVLADVIGYIIPFVIILLTIKALKITFKALVESIGLGAINHPLGAVLSFIKTSITLIFLLSLLQLSSFSNSVMFRQSQVVEIIQPQINWTINQLPALLSDRFNKTVFDDFDSQKAQVYEAIKEKSSELSDKTSEVSKGTLKKIDQVIGDIQN